MVVTETYARSAWEDRFNQPMAEQLRAGLDTEPRSLFDAARRRLAEIEGVVEGYAWHGHCWRWAIEYRTCLSDDPLAIIIPSPTDLQVAVPFDESFVKSLAKRQLKRSIREGVDLVREPFDSRWTTWTLSSAVIIDDLVELVTLKAEHLRGRSR